MGWRPFAGCQPFCIVVREEFSETNLNGSGFSDQQFDAIHLHGRNGWLIPES
jgi:hypothetical protein